MRQSTFRNLYSEIACNLDVFGKRSAILKLGTHDKTGDMVANGEVGDILASLDHISRVVAATDHTMSIEVLDCWEGHSQAEAT